MNLTVKECVQLAYRVVHIVPKAAVCRYLDCYIGLFQYLIEYNLANLETAAFQKFDVVFF